MKKKLKVCTIGGGSGIPIVNRALVRAGFEDIHSIVTTFDSGGDSGRMRTDERGNLLAFSDYWRSLMSLWKDGQKKHVWEEMLRYRDGRGRNFGNTFFQFMAEKTGDMSGVDSLFKELTGANLMGEVIPVSIKPADICFETISGKNFKGEHNLDDYRMSDDCVKKIWLEPEVEASDEAIKSIKEADVIIVGPGSIYGSILVNFLPKGVSDAFLKSKAKKILISNLVSVANEGKILNEKVYDDIFVKYIGKNNVFDMKICPDFSKINKKTMCKIIANYEYEHSFLVKSLNNKNDIVIIDKKNMRLRHSVLKLANLFSKLLVK